MRLIWIPQKDRYVEIDAPGQTSVASIELFFPFGDKDENKSEKKTNLFVWRQIKIIESPDGKKKYGEEGREHFGRIISQDDGDGNIFVLSKSVGTWDPDLNTDTFPTLPTLPTSFSNVCTLDVEVSEPNVFKPNEETWVGGRMHLVTCNYNATSRISKPSGKNVIKKIFSYDNQSKYYSFEPPWVIDIDRSITGNGHNSTNFFILRKLESNDRVYEYVFKQQNYRAIELYYGFFIVGSKQIRFVTMEDYFKLKNGQEMERFMFPKHLQMTFVLNDDRTGDGVYVDLDV